MTRPHWKSSLRLSNTHFDLSLPFWRDYQSFLQQLAGLQFPNCEQLNALLADDLKSADRQPIHFVPSSELDDAAYEQRIFETGQVSTRPDSWHDLFNALVWMRFPRLKSAMNTLHYCSNTQSTHGTRGSQRDALTLFDECGILVFSSDTEALTALAQRDWKQVFQTGICSDQLHQVICGHAMLEKFLTPYKSMTAKALLIKLDKQQMALPREQLLKYLDERMAGLLLEEKILKKPAALTPLPLAGIPGWWIADKQDEAFYADRNVFRPPPAGTELVSPIKL